MAYIGKAPVNGFHSKQTLSTDGSTTTFTLDFTVADETSLIVSVGGVLQEPKVAYNLAGGGTSIVFTAAPAATDTAYIQYLGQAIVQNLLDINGAALILDADGDTTITADTDDQIDIAIAGADDFQFTANKFSVLTGSNQSFADSAKGLFGTGDDLEVYHDGTNSYIANKTGALKIATETSGIALTIGHTTSETTVADNLTVTGNLTVGGATSFGDFDITNVGSIALDTITNDGTDITLDSSADIVVDAAGGNVEFKDAGTLQLTLDMDGTAGAQVIQLGVDSDDLIFKQYDGTTVLTLDDDTTVKVATDLTIGDDASLISDAAVLNFGANSEIKLTHVHDTGLLLNAASVLQFRDSAINIGSPADGDLDINADDEIELNSTLIDINGNVEISGTAVTTGVHTFTAVPVFPNNTVESADIQADAITGAKIADNAIDSEHYTDASIDLAHMSANSIDTNQYVDGSIDLIHLSDNSVDSRCYVDSSIDAAHIGSNSVTTAKINADAVTGAKIADDAINSEHYTDGSIDTAHIAADQITNAKIADDQIDSEHYVDGSIDTAHIADGQITIGKLATAVLTGATDIGAALVDADLMLVDDGAGGTLRKSAMSRIKTYIGGTGKVAQVVQVFKTSVFSTTSSSLVDVTGLTVAITPTASNSKVLVIVNTTGSATDNSAQVLLRGSTVIGGGAAASNRTQSYGGSMLNFGQPAQAPYGITVLDSPATTDAVTYKIQAGAVGGGTTYFGRDTADNDNAQHARTPQQITLMEILA